jgi:hypothetical protein
MASLLAAVLAFVRGGREAPLPPTAHPAASGWIDSADLGHAGRTVFAAQATRLASGVMARAGDRGAFFGLEGEDLLAGQVAGPDPAVVEAGGDPGRWGAPATRTTRAASS